MPFIGGEPSSAEVFKGIESKGFSTKELMAYLLMRMVPIWRRKNQLSNMENFAIKADNYLANSPEFLHIPKDKRLTFNEFTAWYDAHKAEIGGKELFAINVGDCYHDTPAPPTYFHKIGMLREEMRNQHLIAVAADALKKYDRVMVVYGAAHQQETAPVFEQMFSGPPIEEYLVLSQTKPKPVEPVIHRPSQPAPGNLPKLFKQAAVALLAVAVVVAVTSGSVLLLAGLFAASAAAFAGGAIAEAEQRKPPVSAAQTLTAGNLAISVSEPSPSQSVQRSDGKSWAEISASAKPLSRSI